MVPGSTLMYGSSLMLVTRMPRDSRIAAREAAAIPFPRLETTPPVTNTYLVMYAEQGVKAGVYTRLPDGALQVAAGADRSSLNRGVDCLRRQRNANALGL